MLKIQNKNVKLCPIVAILKDMENYNENVLFKIGPSFLRCCVVALQLLQQL